jgi:beta-mannosidase
MTWPTRRGSSSGRRSCSPGESKSTLATLADDVCLDVMVCVRSALYPRTTDFLTLVEEEVKQQVRRLQSHPSIALWGGNNENEIALSWFSQSTSNRDLYVVDYNELYINAVHRTLAGIDPDRAWVDSSPSNGLISKDPYVKRWGQPGALNYGDLHHYDFFSDCEVPASFPK